MSKPRYNWWPFALNIIRDYPQHARKLKELQQVKLTADISGMPRAGGASRSTEGVALRQLPIQEQREYEAVHTALLRTQTMKAADQRIKIIKLSFWKGYSIKAAATVVNETPDTAETFRWQFIMLVGRMYGFLTEEEYLAELKYRRTGRKKGAPKPK